MLAGLVDELPQHAFTGAVAIEANQLPLLIPVETLDRVVQSALWILFGLWRQRIVDPRRPPHLLKHGKNHLLIDGRPFELLHQHIAECQPAAVGVPKWSHGLAAPRLRCRRGWIRR